MHVYMQKRTKKKRASARDALYSQVPHQVRLTSVNLD